MRKTTLLLLGLCAYLTGLALPPAVTSFSPTSAGTGMTVNITGTDLSGTTAVNFGGTPAASFTIVSNTLVRAVVGVGNSGSVQVVNADGSSSATGFNYVTTPGIVTDFGGYWPSSMASLNAAVPDNSHNLLAFTYNGATYSTGANNSTLTSQGVSFTPGLFKALPVAGISGVTSGGSTYLALARRVDGSATVAYTPAVAHYSVKTALTDGIGGLDLGTGVTNLPNTAVLTFQIFSINPARINDAEPDIILTQIADPSTGNDVFSFIDAAGNVVGNSISQNMTLLPSFGNYLLDLYNLTPSTPYNTATAYSASSTSVTRNIRLVAFRLSDFGITTANVGQVRALKLTPSTNSDYAFIAYNANAINLPPNVSADNARSNTLICDGGIASMTVEATPAAGGALSYAWEESTDGGSTWTAIADGGAYAGATAARLSVTGPAHDTRYRAIVEEAGNANPATSTEFSVTVITAPEAPTAVTVAGGGSICLNAPAQLTSTVTGGSNLFYQWETDASGSFQEIPGANGNRLLPVIDQTGSRSYRLRVSSGSGCVPFLTSAPVTVTVGGVASVTPAARCQSGSLTLGATASAGTLSWYTTDIGGTEAGTGTSFTTPVLAATTTYYVVASGCASALRTPVTATVYPASVGGTVNGSTMVVETSNTTTLTLEGATGNIVMWQSSTDAFTSDITNIPHTSNSLTVSGLTQTTQYRAVAQSGSCDPAYATPATITVGGVLPLQAGSLRVEKQGQKARLEWKAYQAEKTAYFEIERSVDGRPFGKTGQVAAAEGQSTYSWVDEQPAPGVAIYRIREVLTSGEVQYSNQAKIQFGESQPGFTVYPNPVRNRRPMLQLQQLPAGRYQLRCINASGQVVLEETVVLTAGSNVRPLNLPEKLAPGLYRVHISGEGGWQQSTGLLLQ